MSQADLSKKVMKQIHEQKISMRPYGFFIAMAILIGIGLLGTALLSVFFIGFIVSDFRLQQPLRDLWIDRFGWSYVLLHLPWLALVVAVVGLGGGYLLLRRFEFIYRYNRALIIAGLILVTIMISVIVSDTGLTDRFLKQSTDEIWIDGTVISTNSAKDDWQIAENNHHNSTIYWNKQTKFLGNRHFDRGDGIDIVAHRINNHLVADSVEKENSIIDYH